MSPSWVRTWAAAAATSTLGCGWLFDPLAEPIAEGLTTGLLESMQTAANIELVAFFSANYYCERARWPQSIDELEGFLTEGNPADDATAISAGNNPVSEEGEPATVRFDWGHLQDVKFSETPSGDLLMSGLGPDPAEPGGAAVHVDGCSKDEQGRTAPEYQVRSPDEE